MMRTFILKAGFFILPFLFIHIMNLYCYQKNEGDLIRMGYLYFNPSPKTDLSNQFSMNKKYTLVSELRVDSKVKFDVLTIGDSFSGQGSLGYKNFLAEKNITVLHMDGFLTEDNPIQKLIELINGDFFDSIHINQIILQSIERSVVERSQKIDYSKSIKLDSIIRQVKNYDKKKPKLSIDFFSNATIKIPLTNIQYYFTNKPKYSKTYKVPTNTDNLFSGSPNHLLFYEDDLSKIKDKNDSLKIVLLNDILNKISDSLSYKNIQLITLISPDKYDLYYPYIQNKNPFKKPLFFKYYNGLSKGYNYVPAFEVLSKEIKKNKDIYYYSDTHWSPLGASIIAKEINKIITEI